MLIRLFRVERGGHTAALCMRPRDEPAAHAQRRHENEPEAPHEQNLACVREWCGRVEQRCRPFSENVSEKPGMGYSGGLLNIAAYLDRLRIRVFCMSR
jgi:hypothetical protein